MKFLAVYTPDAKTAGIPPTKEHMAKMGKFVEESFKSGVLLATGGLLPVSRAAAPSHRAGHLSGPGHVQNRLHALD